MGDPDRAPGPVGREPPANTAGIDWGDGTTTAGVVTERSGRGTCAASHAYAAAGDKTIRVTVRDDEGAEGTAAVRIAVAG